MSPRRLRLWVPCEEAEAGPSITAMSESVELCVAQAQGDHLLLAAFGLCHVAAQLQMVARRRATRLFFAGVVGVTQNEHGSVHQPLELEHPLADWSTLQMRSSPYQTCHVSDHMPVSNCT